MDVSSNWFTGPRVRRLQRLVHLLPSRPPGINDNQLTRTLRPQIDSPSREIPQLVRVLTRLGLVHVDSNRFYLSRNGRRAATLSEARARIELAELLIQSGLMHEQVRQVIEASTIDHGGMACSRVGQMRRSAPQLLGILRAWPDIVGPSFVRIPSDLFAVIDAPWSLVPSPSKGEDNREAVGHRAEAYSFYFLRHESKRSNSVIWVSRDDQGLGYDIEDSSTGQVHRVEVKGSQGKDLRFFLSGHEHEVAHQDPSSYEIHFWGEINLNRSPSIEFAILRDRGFPLRFENLAAHLADQRLKAKPTKFLVTGGSGDFDDA